MSKYVLLMKYRHEALMNQDQEAAERLWEMIQKLIDSGEVTEEEFNQIDYF